MQKTLQRQYPIKLKLATAVIILGTSFILLATSFILLASVIYILVTAKVNLQ